MSWYSRVLIAAPTFNCVVRPGPQGVNLCYITGPTWTIPQQLKANGFRYDNVAKSWSRDAASFQKDVAAQQALQTLGVPIPSFPATGASPQQPVKTPTVNPTTPQAPQPANAKRNWLLAEVINLPPLSPGDPVVIAKSGPDNWDWMDKESNTGVIPTAQIQQCVKSVRDRDGKIQQSFNPNDLFSKFEALAATESPDEAPMPQTQAQPLTPEQAERRKKGTIAPHNITPEQQAITDDFGKGQNIATAALAGTGKTTAIFHLACT